ncbi:MAG: PDZ domain-containing protein [Planctomycetes bacterium]|nr:PDZ domain-containing protein [Planctomycetota bacterium]
MRTLLLAALLGPGLGACSSLFGSGELPRESPPLVALQEPLALQNEPQDEPAREALPTGSFSGLYVADARASLDELLGDPQGLRIALVVENSPGDAAGLVEDDVLLSVRTSDGQETQLHWPSEWRALELGTPPGSALELVYDRAGAEQHARLVLVPRVHPAERVPVVRLREEARVGIVLRNPTEVEARAAGLAPGAGAVVVGLAEESPWRKAGLRFQDLILAIDGEPVAHPQVVLDRVRSAEANARLRLSIARGTERLELDAPLTQRARELKEISIPILFDYEKQRGASETSILLGLLRYRHTQAAWDWRLLWFISFGGGDADKLEKVRY